MEGVSDFTDPGAGTEQRVVDRLGGVLPKRATDVRGVRFGELVPVRPLENTFYGIRWLCRCDCGRDAVRLLAHLRRSVRLGHRPCCNECLAELRRGHGKMVHDDRTAWFVERYRDGVGLYGHDELENMTREIFEMAGLETEPVPASFTVDPARIERPNQADKLAQRRAYQLACRKQRDGRILQAQRAQEDFERQQRLDALHEWLREESAKDHQ